MGQYDSQLKMFLPYARAVKMYEIKIPFHQNKIFMQYICWLYLSTT